MERPTQINQQYKKYYICVILILIGYIIYDIQFKDIHLERKTNITGLELMCLGVGYLIGLYNINNIIIT